MPTVGDGQRSNEVHRQVLPGHGGLCAMKGSTMTCGRRLSFGSARVTRGGDRMSQHFGLEDKVAGVHEVLQATRTLVT